MWLLFMGSQPHKEERFMFPVYPLCAFAAAFVVREAVLLYDRWRIRVCYTDTSPHPYAHTHTLGCTVCTRSRVCM